MTGQLMMRRARRSTTLLALLAGGWACGGLAAIPAGAAVAMPEHGERVDLGGILDRLERGQRMSPENGALLREGLRHMNQFVPMLELALLELFGPLEVRNRAAGLQRLEALLEEAPAALTPEAERLLRWLSRAEAIELERERARSDLELQLEQERLRHLETLKKLEGLRQVERELDPETGGRPERPR